jgi:hypothetical protein
MAPLEIDLDTCICRQLRLAVEAIETFGDDTELM